LAKEGELKKETTELGVKQGVNYTSLSLEISKDKPKSGRNKENLLKRQ